MLDSLGDITSPRDLFRQLAARKLLIVSGKGGVGRTTVALLVARALAEQGHRVLLATTGHDDRLAWMCGAKSLPEDHMPVSAVQGLWITRLMPHRCVREYGELVLHSRRIASALFDNRLVRRLMGAVPGLDDFAVLGKVWHEATRAGTYSCVVFDGPASGHLRLNLGVPRAIVETVSQGPLAREARAMDACLTDPQQTSALLVGLPQSWSLTELAELAKELRESLGVSSSALVVNKLWPATVPELRAPDRSFDPDGTVGKVFTTVAEIARRGQQQGQIVRDWLASPPARACGARSFLQVPWWPQGLDGPEQLEALSRSLRVCGGEGVSC